MRARSHTNARARAWMILATSTIKKRTHAHTRARTLALKCTRTRLDVVGHEHQLSLAAHARDERLPLVRDDAHHLQVVCTHGKAGGAKPGG